MLATQNPIEYEGTYPLPEAQLDRFMVRVSLGYPSVEDEKDMLAEHSARDRVLDLEPVTGVGEVLAAQAAVAGVHGSEALRRYIVTVLDATRADPRVELGASPRAGLMLFRAAKALAALDGRDHALPDDVQALAPAVLTHRLLLAPEAAGDDRAAVVRDALERVPGSVRRHDAEPPERPSSAPRWRWRRCCSTRPRCWVPGVALIGARGGRRALGRARRARRGDRAHARAGDDRGGAALPAAARAAPGAAAAARRRAARAAAGRAPMPLTGRTAGKVRIDVRFARRGRRVLEPGALAIADPLRLAVREIPSVGEPAELLVLPRVEPVVATRRGRAPAAPARVPTPAADAPRCAGGMDGSAAELDLDGLRPYREGTPACRIHWPAVARSGEMLERRLTADADSAPLVVLDATAAALGGGAGQGGASGGLAVRAPRPPGGLRAAAAR